MRWPWQRTEHRASATDALVAAIVAAAGNQGTGDHRAIAAVETAAGLYAAALSSAKVETDDAQVAARLTPAFLSMMARALIRRGEFLAVLEATPARGLELLPAGSWDVRGGPVESGWWYRADLFGPSGSTSRLVPSAQVIHCRWSVDPSRPWVGVSPLQSASSTGALAANLEQRLAEEAGASVGAFIPTPKNDGDHPDADDDPLGKLRGDIRNAKGRAVLVESMATAWGEGPGAAPHGDWRAHRFGADPPDALGTLRTAVGLDVLAACGVPGALVMSDTAQGAREGWRRFVLSSCAGMAALITDELGAKLAPTAITFDELNGRDLAVRSQAYSRLVGEGKLSSDEARIVVGL